MPTYGPNSFSATTDLGGAGSVTWTGSSYTMPDTTGTNAETKKQLIHGFGFAIPVSEAIVGIEITIDGPANPAPIGGIAPDASLGGYVYNGSAEVGDGIDYGSSPWSGVVQNYGGASDDLNTGLTPAQANSANFGIALVGTSEDYTAYDVGALTVEITITTVAVITTGGELPLSGPLASSKVMKGFPLT